MLPIAHFGIGITIGMIVLYVLDTHGKIKNKWLLRYDLFVILGFGLFAILPDVGILFGYPAIDDNMLANIFCFHYFLERFPDDAVTAVKALVLPLITTIFYFGWVRKLKLKKK